MNKNYLISSGIFLAVFFAGYLVRRYFFKLFTAWAARTETKLDDIILSAVKNQFLIWIIILAVEISIKNLSFTGKYLKIIDKTLLILFIISFTLVVSGIIGGIIKEYEIKAAKTIKSTSLSQSIINVVFFGISFLIILNVLGVSIAPIITALGVGGIAVGLALQDTLSNLFSGIYIILAKQLKVGDYIKLSSGEEGYIQDISWRSTKIKTLPNNIVIIPNIKISQSVITNYFNQDKQMAVLVEIGVSYGSELEKVEKITIETAKEIMNEIPGGVKDFIPFIRYHTFGEYSINFTVIMRCQQFVDQYIIKHEFVKRLHSRYKRENVEIPFPIRTIQINNPNS